MWSRRFYPTNLQDTCGHCHPGISEELAQSKIHEMGFAKMRGWPDFFAVLYMIVITLTVAGMLTYIGLDYRRQVQGGVSRETGQTHDGLG